MRDSWPIYFKDRLIVSNLDSPVAIASLWTPKELIQKKVPAQNYCLLGQLYTKRGINYLLRNILAKPTIRKLYLVGSDLMGSGEAFLKFDFNIEPEISPEAIKDFRKNVEVIDMMGPEKLADVEKVLSKALPESALKSPAKKWRKPEIFPEPAKPEISRYPSEIDLTKIRRPTIAEAYLSVLKHINMFGLESEAVISYVSDTSKKMKEMLNLSVVVTDEDPKKWYLPDYLPFSGNELAKYFQGFFDPHKGDEDYTYGERLFNYSGDEITELQKIYPWLRIDRFQKFFPHGGIDQVAISIIRKLAKFPYDKGAIALLGNTYTDIFPQRPPKKIPCLFLIQCQVYQGRLNMTAYFRSNDMYNAWTLNAFALRKLQSEIAEKLDVEMGPLVTISNMAHIYEHNWRDAEKLVEEHYQGNCEWDPRGNFHVAVEDKEIVVKWVTPRGNEEIKEWRYDGTKPKIAARIMFDLIEKELAVSVLGHAADLALQIERAETAVKLGLKFEQDNPLDYNQTRR